MLDEDRFALRGRACAARGLVLLLAVAAIGSGATPAAADEYRYDALGRLIGVTYTNGAVVHYVYDAAGNRTTVIADLTGATPPPSGYQAAGTEGSGQNEVSGEGDVEILHEDVVAPAEATPSTSGAAPGEV